MLMSTYKLGRHQRNMAYLFITPCILLFVLFTGIPIVKAIYLSFTDYDVLTETDFVGLANYKRLFQDEIFLITLKNILSYVVLFVPLMVGFSLTIALALNKEIKGRGLFRTIFYLPTLTSAIAASTVWVWIFNPEYGLLNQLLGYLGIAGPMWISHSDTAMLSIVIVTLWQGVGGNMIIYLAGLQGVPKVLYESAQLDGANKWQSFWYITIPGLRSTTFFVVIMSMIGSFQLFDQAFAMTKGGPGYATMTPVYLIYNQGFNQLDMGYASAMAFVLFIIILGLSLINFRLNKKD